MFDTDTIAEAGSPAGCSRPIALPAATRGDLDAATLLETMITREFAGRIALVLSFGAEAAVLLDLVA
ncbi:MAG: hypothetical protein VCD33_03875 [Alphaproteobacteria bacterium]